MNIFAKRFRYLRENEKGWTQEETAKAIGVRRATIAGYESETKGRLPREETLIKIADTFNVSIDYLLGRTDMPRAIKGLTEDEINFIRTAKAQPELLHLLSSCSPNKLQEIKRLLQD